MWTFFDFFFVLFKKEYRKGSNEGLRLGGGAETETEEKERGILFCHPGRYVLVCARTTCAGEDCREFDPPSLCSFFENFRVHQS